MIAARVPLLIATIHLLLVGLPDQSAEAARIMLTWPWWQAALAYYGLLAFCIYFGLALGAHGLDAMERDGLLPSGEPVLAVHRLVLALLIAAPALGVTLALDPVSIFEGREGVLLGGSRWLLYPALLLFAIASAAPVLVLLLGLWSKTFPDPVGALRRIPAPAMAEVSLNLLVLWLAIAGLGAVLFDASWWVPTLLLLTLWTPCLLLVGWPFRLRPGQRRSPWPLFLLAWVLLLSWFQWNENHQIRHRPAPRIPPPELTAAFATWLEVRAAERTEYARRGVRYPVLLIAAEGGGARAAYFTAAAVEALRARCPHLLRHGFLLAGVSGGSVGAALVAADAAARPERHAPLDPQALFTCGPTPATIADSPMLRALRADLLSPLVFGLLVPDLLARFLPGAILPAWWAEITDRARFLERALDRAWRGASGFGLEERGFQGAWRGPAGDLPALMLLTTDVATGRRVAVSHLAMPGGRPLPEAGCATPLPVGAPATNLARLVALAEEAPGIDLPLSTAAILSARFPVLTPAGTLPCPGPSRRLVDGGYFENSGLTTILEVMDALTPQAVAAGVALVVLRLENGGASTNPQTALGAKPRKPDHALPELGSPLRALLATRQARGEAATAEVSQRVMAARECKAGAACLELRQEVLRLHPSCVFVPLGWALSDRARAEMQRQILGQPATNCTAEPAAELEAEAQLQQNRAALDAIAALLSPAARP
jgi:hypothetical protein